MIKTYKNPPVVEAWIDFHFEYGEESSDWSKKIAVDFINRFSQFKREEYPALVQKGIKLSQDGSIASHEDVFIRLKSFNSENDRCIQVEQALLVYNMLRKKDVEWPGFSVLLEEAIAFCQEYISFFHPLKVRPVLHYRDNIIIPFIDGKIEPKDYFGIYPEVPDDKFGNMSDFALSLILHGICENGVARFSARTKPIELKETNSELPFIIDWDVQSADSFDCDSLKDCKEWLDVAHKGVHVAFERYLTDKCRILFEE